MILSGLNCGEVIRMIPPNAPAAARYFLSQILPTAACVVDATAGNGYDTLYLCQNSPADCRIWSFDIQQEALSACSTLLARHGFTHKTNLIHADHATLRDYIKEPVDAAMFNLGYLPGHDHSVTTGPHSLRPALDELLALLAPEGQVTIVAYPGHKPGQEEIEFLEEYLEMLPQNLFTAVKFSYMNQKNSPAILYSIGKTRRNPR